MKNKGDKFTMTEHQQRHDWYNRHAIIVMVNQLPSGMIDILLPQIQELVQKATDGGLYPYKNPWGSAIKE